MHRLPSILYVSTLLVSSINQLPAQLRPAARPQARPDSQRPGQVDAQQAETARALQTELTQVEAEIGRAQSKNDSVAGGLVKALIEARIEILKTTQALIKQRIQAAQSGARITVSVPGTVPDAALAASLAAEIQTKTWQ